jgi:tRNA (guanine-N7-)-methyltransferase
MDQPEGDDNTNNNSKRKQAEGEGESNAVAETATTTTTTTTTATATAFVPITQEGDRPQKKFYRQRAHCNPLSHNDSFDYPLRPDLMNWTTEAFYPGLLKRDGGAATNHTTTTSSSSSSTSTSNDAAVVAHAQPTVLDVGCGFGGLTLALARLLPHEIILGMEIRAKVTEYVRLRIAAARKDPNTALLEDDNDNGEPTTTTASSTSAAAVATTEAIINFSSTTSTAAVGPTTGETYQNAAVLRTNSMKFLPHYFAKHSLHKLFFCFPDPHFKRKNHARRIISDRLLTEYAYLLQPDVGRLYCITDVRELHEWHVQKCSAHPCFECLVVVHPQDALASSPPDIVECALRDDPCIRAMMLETEEGKKVHRNGGDKFFAVYRRRDTASTTAILHGSNFFA